MKLKKFINTFKNILTKPLFYAELVKRPLISAITFFVISLTLIGILDAAYLNYIDIPKWQQSLTQASQNIVDHYPSDLLIKWNNGKLESLKINSAGQTEVYTDSILLNYPSIDKQLKEGLPEKFISIQTHRFDENTLKKNGGGNSLVIIGSENLYLNNHGLWQKLPLNTFLDHQKQFEITPNNIVTHQENFVAFLPSIIKKVQLAIFIISPLLSITARFSTLAINSLFIMLITRFYGLKEKYITFLKISLYVGVIAQLITYVSMLINRYLDFPVFGFSYWVISLYLLIAVGSQLKLKKYLLKKVK